MTPRDLIKNTLRLIGVVASGETPIADQSNDALSTLNSMIKSWSIEGLMVFKVTSEQFSLVSGRSAQTIGTGGDFNTERPEKIIKVVTKNGTQDLPVEIITVEQWAQIPDKTSQSSFPFRVYIEGTYPLNTLNFWPVPSQSSYVTIYSRKKINSTLALSDTISLPEGYEEALQYNLAKRLAPEYGKQLDPLVLAEAQDLKAQIMRQNEKPSFMQTDAPTPRGMFNIYRGV